MAESIQDVPTESPRGQGRIDEPLARKYQAEQLGRQAKQYPERSRGQAGAADLRLMRGERVSLYVNVNGESGYFDRSLDAYGREGESCRRCGAVMRREKFMNRSSFYCPKCQPRPRR